MVQSAFVLHVVFAILIKGLSCSVVDELSLHTSAFALTYRMTSLRQQHTEFSNGCNILPMTHATVFVVHHYHTPHACARQTVKPAKDLKLFLSGSLGQDGPFPPSCRELDSGWEVRSVRLHRFCVW